jgi:response regulator RpfG family c-di-GMP phosphodiesterase
MLMLKRVLFVDDEADVLSSFKRQLRKQFEVEIAQGGLDGLAKIKNAKPFAVVVSDYNMPGMDGIEFLAKVKTLAPESVRVMLTGQAAMDTAIKAVNEGNIYRFLTKPCPNEMLVKTLHASIELHQMIIAEKELLEKTLSGSIHVLTEVLSLVNPVAFSKAQGVKTCVNHIVRKLKIPRAWQFELAALLSTIGCVTIPPELLNKVDQGINLTANEQEIVANHPGIARDLLIKIPRMSNVAGMIAAQRMPFKRINNNSDFCGENFITLGGNLILIAMDYNSLTLKGNTRRSSILMLAQQPEKYFREAVESLSDFVTNQGEAVERSIKVNELRINMILNENILSTAGMLIAVKGQDVSNTMIQRLQAFSKSSGIREPFRVMVS